MISGKMLAQQLEKFLVSPVCQNARVQVKLPTGEFRSPDGYFDVKKIYLLQKHGKTRDQVLAILEEEYT